MDTVVVRRMPAWRGFVWAGVISSVLAWAWAWNVARGPSVVMLFVALASVVLAYRGTQGMRLALVGLMVCGLAMFLAALYWTFLLVLPPVGQVPAHDWVAVSGFPMVAAVVLLMGAVPGFRHANRSA